MSADEPIWWQADPTTAVTTPGPLGRRRRMLTAVAVAGGVALTGGVAVAAASGGGKANTARPGPGGGGFGGPGGSGGAGGPQQTGKGTHQQQATTPDSQGYAGSTSGSQGGAGGGTGGFGGPGSGPGRGGAMAAIHGEYVVETSTGKFETELTQRGTASAVSASAITVTSSDGYAKTYVVPSTISVGSVKTGDSVTVTATLSSTTATLTDLRSGTAATGTTT